MMKAFLILIGVETRLCVSLGCDRFFLRLQLIDMDRFISEGAFDGADQLKTDQISAFRAPWKILAFADGE